MATAAHVVAFSSSAKPPAAIGCEYGIKGKRDAMEDASVYARWICKHRGSEAVFIDLFGIFDGHGGKEASELVSQILPRLIATELRCPVNQASVRASLTRAFQQMQTYMQAFFPQKFQRQGTTAVVVLRVGNTLFCANVGDSRAVTCANGSGSVDLSNDHKPNLRSEKSRIQQLGGYVNLPSDGTPRVWKSKTDGSIGLSTSRSLGDLESQTPSGEYLVSPIPDVTTRSFTPGNTIVILACDGVWDVTTSPEACRVVRSSDSAAKACKNLVRHAFNKGSTDNISAMIIHL